MRQLLLALAIILLASGVTACGSASDHAGSASVVSKTSTAGGASDPNAGLAVPKSFDSDDAPIRFFGHEAGPPERQAITALITRYYMLAARENGAKACPLIDSLISERIPEEFGEVPGLRGKTCAVIMSKLFKQHHRQLALDSSTLEVTGVRVEGGRALVLVRFAKAPVPTHTAVHREGPAWKIWELFSTQLP